MQFSNREKKKKIDKKNYVNRGFNIGKNSKKFVSQTVYTNIYR